MLERILNCLDDEEWNFEDVPPLVLGLEVDAKVAAIKEYVNGHSRPNNLFRESALLGNGTALSADLLSNEEVLRIGEAIVDFRMDLFQDEAILNQIENLKDLPNLAEDAEDNNIVNYIIDNEEVCVHLGYSEALEMHDRPDDLGISHKHLQIFKNEIRSRRSVLLQELDVDQIKKFFPDATISQIPHVDLPENEEEAAEAVRTYLNDNQVLKSKFGFKNTDNVTEENLTDKEAIAVGNAILNYRKELLAKLTKDDIGKLFPQGTGTVATIPFFDFTGSDEQKAAAVVDYLNENPNLKGALGFPTTVLAGLEGDNSINETDLPKAAAIAVGEAILAYRKELLERSLDAKHLELKEINALSKLPDFKNTKNDLVNYLNGEGIALRTTLGFSAAVTAEVLPNNITHIKALVEEQRKALLGQPLDANDAKIIAECKTLNDLPAFRASGTLSNLAVYLNTPGQGDKLKKALGFVDTVNVKSTVLPEDLDSIKTLITDRRKALLSRQLDATNTKITEECKALNDLPALPVNITAANLVGYLNGPGIKLKKALGFVETETVTIGMLPNDDQLNHITTLVTEQRKVLLSQALSAAGTKITDECKALNDLPDFPAAITAAELAIYLNGPGVKLKKALGFLDGGSVTAAMLPADGHLAHISTLVIERRKALLGVLDATGIADHFPNGTVKTIPDFKFEGSPAERATAVRSYLNANAELRTALGFTVIPILDAFLPENEALIVGQALINCRKELLETLNSNDVAGLFPGGTVKTVPDFKFDGTPNENAIAVRTYLDTNPTLKTALGFTINPITPILLPEAEALKVGQVLVNYRKTLLRALTAADIQTRFPGGDVFTVPDFKFDGADDVKAQAVRTYLEANAGLRTALGFTNPVTATLLPEPEALLVGEALIARRLQLLNALTAAEIQTRFPGGNLFAVPDFKFDGTDDVKARAVRTYLDTNAGLRTALGFTDPVTATLLPEREALVVGAALTAHRLQLLAALTAAEIQTRFPRGNAFTVPDFKFADLLDDAAKATAVRTFLTANAGLRTALGFTNPVTVTRLPDDKALIVGQALIERRKVLLGALAARDIVALFPAGTVATIPDFKFDGNNDVKAAALRTYLDNPTNAALKTALGFTVNPITPTLLPETEALRVGQALAARRQELLRGLDAAGIAALFPTGSVKTIPDFKFDGNNDVKAAAVRTYLDNPTNAALKTALGFTINPITQTVLDDAEAVAVGQALVNRRQELLNRPIPFNILQSSLAGIGLNDLPNMLGLADKNTVILYLNNEPPIGGGENLRKALGFVDNAGNAIPVEQKMLPAGDHGADHIREAILTRRAPLVIEKQINDIDDKKITPALRTQLIELAAVGNNPAEIRRVLSKIPIPLFLYNADDAKNLDLTKVSTDSLIRLQQAAAAKVKSELILGVAKNKSDLEAKLPQPWDLSTADAKNLENFKKNYENLFNLKEAAKYGADQDAFAKLSEAILLLQKEIKSYDADIKDPGAFGPIKITAAEADEKNANDELKRLETTKQEVERHIQELKTVLPALSSIGADGKLTQPLKFTDRAGNIYDIKSGDIPRPTDIKKIKKEFASFGAWQAAPLPTKRYHELKIAVNEYKKQEKVVDSRSIEYSKLQQSVAWRQEAITAMNNLTAEMQVIKAVHKDQNDHVRSFAISEEKKGATDDKKINKDSSHFADWKAKVNQRIPGVSTASPVMSVISGDSVRSIDADRKPGVNEIFRTYPPDGDDVTSKDMIYYERESLKSNGSCKNYELTVLELPEHLSARGKLVAYLKANYPNGIYDKDPTKNKRALTGEELRDLIMKSSTLPANFTTSQLEDFLAKDIRVKWKTNDSVVEGFKDYLQEKNKSVEKYNVQGRITSLEMPSKAMFEEAGRILSTLVANCPHSTIYVRTIKSPQLSIAMSALIQAGKAGNKEIVLPISAPKATKDQVAVVKGDKWFKAVVSENAANVEKKVFGFQLQSEHEVNLPKDDKYRMKLGKPG